jgi:hypothetical protein
MVSGIPPLGITQNERFLSCDTILLGVCYVSSFLKNLASLLRIVFLSNEITMAIAEILSPTSRMISNNPD